MKYQVRIKDRMSDKPASELFDTIEEAEAKLAEVKEEIRTTWATPNVNAAYIFVNQLCGSNIRNYREKHGLTQKQICEAIGMPKRTLEDWEGERRKPTEWVEALVIEKLKSIYGN